MNFQGLGSVWKQGQLLSEHRLLDLDMAAIGETMISNVQATAAIFGDNVIFSSCALSE